MSHPECDTVGDPSVLTAQRLRRFAQYLGEGAG
jgi:hypothetical protein